MTWLLDAGQPWVQYRARLDLLGEAEDDAAVRTARAAVLTDPQVQSLGSILQGVLPSVHTRVFQTSPFALMIIVLVLVRNESLGGVAGALAWPQRSVAGAPAARDATRRAGHAL